MSGQRRRCIHYIIYVCVCVSYPVDGALVDKIERKFYYLRTFIVQLLWREICYQGRKERERGFITG